MKYWYRNCRCAKKAYQFKKVCINNGEVSSFIKNRLTLYEKADESTRHRLSTPYVSPNNLEYLYNLKEKLKNYFKKTAVGFNK